MSPPIERILLALDATAETRPAIDIAVRLAAHAKLELHVMFVEDEELLNLASLPIAREVVPNAGAGMARLEDIELHLRAAAARARADILAAARRHNLECSFEIARGSAQTALSIASERDLVIAGAGARPVAGHFRVASAWPQALGLAPGPVLLARESGKKRSATVVLLRDRTAGSALVLHTAARIAELSGGQLTVICRPELAAAKNLGEWIDDQVAPAEVRLEIETASGEPAALQARLAELDCRLLALDAAVTERGEAAEVTRRLVCDLLVAG